MYTFFNMTENITIRKLNIFTVFDLTGTIKDEESAEFQKTALKQINEGTKDIVINLSKVQNLNSQALGVIIAIWKKIVDAKGSMHIISNPARLKNTLESANLHTIIDIYTSEEEFKKNILTQKVKEFDIKVRTKDKLTILDLADSVGIIAEAIQTDKILQKIVLTKKISLAINMTDIIHLNSTAMGVLIKWNKVIKESGGFFCLFGLNRDLMYYLELVGLNTVFPTFDREEDIHL